MFENPRRGRQVTNFATNVRKILDLKPSSEQIFSEDWRWVPLFSSLFINHLEQVHSRLYMFLRKRRVSWMSALQMSGENRNRLESPLGVWTNPVYKTSWASLPAKQPITVGSSSGLTWSCYMIGVILIFQSVCQKNIFAWCLLHVCVTHYGSANQEFVGRRRPEWTKRVLIAGVPYPLSPIPQSLSLSPFLPIPSLRLLRRLRHNVIYF